MLELKYMDYYDKVYGCWLGKCIGGAAGAKQENNKSLMNYTIADVFPDEIPPNDDFDLQVLWLKEVLQKKGSRFSGKDLADSFAQYNLCLANEYSIAIKNIELGIEPPLSGLFNNDFFKNSMGCPIRSELWGVICPGNPEAAAQYAKLDGMLDHDRESIYGEQFFAAMEACAFFEKDIMKLIEKGMAYVPEDTELAKCIRFAMSQYLNGAEWIETRERMVARFGSSDASYSVINIGITIMALLYGKGDFEKTMLTAVNNGYDTDCTAATACAILGLINGAEGIPPQLLKRIGDVIETGSIAIDQKRHVVTELVKETCEAGLSLRRDGIISIDITDISDGVKPSLPLPAAIPSIEINVEYIGLPSIGYGEKATVIAVLKNNSGQSIEGKLVVEPSEALCTSIGEIYPRIPANAEVRIELDFAVKKDISVFPQRNIVNLTYSCEGEILASRTFGISGAYRMKLIGPFFDNYDTTKYSKDPFKDVQQRFSDGRVDLFSMFNGYATIDRQYIDESFMEIDKMRCEQVNFHQDCFEIDEKIGYKGPCCVYLLYEFLCPKDFNDAVIFIGNNDAYKVWLNNEPVLENNTIQMYMIYNNYKENIVLKKGVNRIVMKIVRTVKEFEFSCRIRNVQNNLHWFTELASVIDP